MSSSSAIRLAALLVLVPLALLVFVLPLTTFGFDSPGQGPGGDFGRTEFDWWGVWSRSGAGGREKVDEKTGDAFPVRKGSYKSMPHEWVRK